MLSPFMRPTSAMAMGAQPPSWNFSMLAVNSVPSTTRKTENTGMASAHGHFQPRTASANTRIVVTSMVPVTAMP